ncbi:MAG: rod shape-determining protein [Firmicutes bacterium]|nr:rod shape-determining protein [Bacillota bacterium]
MGLIEIALDLGSKYTVIYKKGDGIVLREPSIVAVESLGKVRKVIAVGNKAESMQDRTAENIEFVNPINKGKVVNDRLCVEMVSAFLRKVAIPNFFNRFKCIVPVNSTMEKAELDKLKRVLFASGIRDVKFVPSIICSAISANLDLSGNTAHAVVNIGASCTEIAVINYYNIVLGGTIDYGGNLATECIKDYILETFKINTSFSNAEAAKCETATLFENDNISCSFTGACASGEGQLYEVFTGRMAYKVLKDIYANIAKSTKYIINKCNSEVIEDIAKNGIFITGGGSAISGLRQYVSGLTNYNVIVDDNGENSVVLGAGKLLSDYQLLTKILRNN